jgi:hypothetical protein
MLVILAGVSCAPSSVSAMRTLQYEEQALMQVHEENSRGGANPVDRLTRDPEKGSCPVCQF